ncbi:MAG: 2-dehydropantoate 2-reductase, partial [Desulfofustis sp.]
MKIVIFGTGAVGGYFGGRLAQAGHDVTFIARGAHLRAIQSDGLKVNSIKGDFSIQPAKATDRPETVGAVDLILCGVKSWQVAEIADQLKPLVSSDTTIITLQNGIESHAILSEAIGAKHVLPGMCQMISLVEGPGIISHKGIDPYLSIGELDGSSSQRLREISQLFSQVEGVTINASPDILQELW